MPPPRSGASVLSRITTRSSWCRGSTMCAFLTQGRLLYVGATTASFLWNCTWSLTSICKTRPLIASNLSIHLRVLTINSNTSRPTRSYFVMITQRSLRKSVKQKVKTVFYTRHQPLRSSKTLLIRLELTDLLSSWKTHLSVFIASLKRRQCLKRLLKPRRFLTVKAILH